MAPSAPRAPAPRHADPEPVPACAATSLLSAQGLPDFEALDAAGLEATLRALVTQLRKVHGRCFRSPRPADPTWDNVVAPEMTANDAVQRIWSLLDFLGIVLERPELTQLQQRLQPALQDMWNELGNDPGRLARYLALRDAAGYAALPPTRRRIIDLALRELRRGGAAFDPATRARMGAIEQRLQVLGRGFSDRAYEADEALRLIVAPRQLRGIPEAALPAPREPAGEVHGLTLPSSSCDAVLCCAEDRELRRRMYHACVTRASEFDQPRLDNSAPMAEILALRFELARLAGYDSYAEYALEGTMAGSPERVRQFLRELARRAMPQARRELQRLRDFATRKLGLAELQPWDLAYVCRRLEQAGADDPSGPAPAAADTDEQRALQSMFEWARRLFGLRMIEQVPARAWHPEVRLWRVEAADGGLVGHVYTDLHAREGKRGEVCAAPLRHGCLGPDGSAHTPVVVLVCDFERATAAGPLHLDSCDLAMLFHEFGHCLHTLLTQVEEPWAAGLAWLETDAVEWPSQFLEFFASDIEHPDAQRPRGASGERPARTCVEPLPAFTLLQDLRGALFDLRIHHELREFTPETINEAAANIEREFSLLPVPDFSRPFHTLTHVFDAPYPSTLYGYLWGQMLAAELYEHFERHGRPAAAWGARLREQILGLGASRDTIESFRAFLGRDPTIDALLRQRRIGDTA